MKRKIKLFAAFFLLLSAVALNAQQSIPEGLEWEIVNSTSVTIIDYTGKAALVNIPQRIQNLPVTSIGERAFFGCSSLTSITIPSSVTSIGERAFYFCSRLTSITIPSSVMSIGNEAFYFCSRLTSITIPSSVTSIGEAAFYDCKSLTSVTISRRTQVGEDAFPETTRIIYSD